MAKSKTTTETLNVEERLEVIEIRLDEIDKRYEKLPGQLATFVLSKAGEIVMMGCKELTVEGYRKVADGVSWIARQPVKAAKWTHSILKKGYESAAPTKTSKDKGKKVAKSKAKKKTTRKTSTAKTATVPATS